MWNNNNNVTYNPKFLNWNNEKKQKNTTNQKLQKPKTAILKNQTAGKRKIKLKTQHGNTTDKSNNIIKIKNKQEIYDTIEKYKNYQVFQASDGRMYQLIITAARQKKIYRTENNKIQTGREEGQGDYKTEYDAAIIQFFTLTKDKLTKDDKNRPIPISFPFISDFAEKIGKSIVTLHGWKKKYESFAEAYARAKLLQASILSRYSLSGAYNAQYAKFLACNITNMRDKQETTVKKAEKTSEEYIENEADELKRYRDRQAS